MPEKTLLDYTLTPLTVYITRDPNNESIATLTVGVINATESHIACDWIAFIIQIGEGPGDLTAQAGRVSTSSSRPNEWSFKPVEGASGQYRAEPIFPYTGLKAGESISFQLDNIVVNEVLGATKFEIIEMSDDRRTDTKFIAKTASDLRIDYFRASPNSIKPGEYATLEWKTQSAATCTLARAGYPPETVEVTGSRPVSPEDSTVYTLRAYGVGQLQATAFVYVIRVKILDFRGPTVRIAPGAKAALYWRTEFATRCEVKANGKRVLPEPPLQAEKDPYWVYPKEDQTLYELFAFGTQGHTQRAVTVFLQPRFRLSLRDTWKQGVPSGVSYLATMSSLVNDSRIFALSALAGGQFSVLDSSSQTKIFSRNSPPYYFAEPSPDSKRLFVENMLNVSILDATGNYPVVVGSKDQVMLATGAAFHPDGSKIYFACGGPIKLSNQDSEPDASDSAPNATIRGLVFADAKDLKTEYVLRVGLMPGGTSISPDGKTLCLVEMDSGLLYLVDVASRTITDTIKVGDFGGKYHIVNSVWSHDGKKVYATNCTPGKIWVVTLATKQVTAIELGADIKPALLRLGPREIPGFAEGSGILYALCGPDGTVAAISTANDQVISRLSLGQQLNPAFAFVFDAYHTFDWATMAIAPDGKTIYVSDPPHNSIFTIDNGGMQAFATGPADSVELDGTVFEYRVSPTMVYITRDPHNPSIAKFDIAVINNSGSDIVCDWLSFIVLQGEKSGELTTDPGSIKASSSRPDEWSITAIQGAPGQFRAEPIVPNQGLRPGESISFRLSDIVINGELGGSNFEIAEMVDEPRGKIVLINKIRGDLNIDYFRPQPSDIKPGGTAKLEWKTAGAATCILSWPTGSDPDIDVSGSKDVQPANTTIYTLTAHGGDGPDVSAQTAIVVNRVIINLEASPIAVGLDGSSVLTWQVLNSDPGSCRLNPGDFQVEPVGQKTVTLNKTTPFTISAKGGNLPEFKQVIVSVEHPVVRYFRSTTPGKPGDPVTLSWDTQYVKSVSIDQGVGGVAPVGTAVVSNVDQTTYTLTCLGLGEPVKAQVVVPGNKVEIHSVYPICIDTPYSCNERFFGQHFACVWHTSFATSTKLIRVYDNQVVATQSGEFKYYTWVPANRPQVDYLLVAEGPGGPAIRGISLGWGGLIA